jgi:hypothetical protein
MGAASAKRQAARARRLRGCTLCQGCVARCTLRVASCGSGTEGPHRGGSKSTAAARSALADLSIEDRRLGLRSATVPARMEHAAHTTGAQRTARRIRRASRPLGSAPVRRLPAHVARCVAHGARRMWTRPRCAAAACCAVAWEGTGALLGSIDRASRWAHTHAAAARASRERCTGGGPRRADYGMRRGPLGYGTADPIPGGGAAQRRLMD